MQKYISLLKSRKNKPQLIPSFKKPERRLLSVIMAAIDIIPEFRGELLSMVNYGSGKTCKYQSHMEPQYDSPEPIGVRPDGLIVCQRGSKEWSAFIEAKAEDKEIGSEQIQSYTNLAAKLNVDTVISISNTFAATPEELPYHLPNSKKKQREVYHLAWPQIRTLISNMLEEGKFNSDLSTKLAKEILHFMSDPQNGVRTFDQMSQYWPKLVEAISIDVNIKNQIGFVDIVSDWQQERRDLLDKLTSYINSPVKIRHASGAKSTQADRTKYDRELLGNKFELESEFQFTDDNQKLLVNANLKTKEIKIDFSFDCPKGKKAKATTSWLSKQLKHLEGQSYFIKIDWPGYGKDTLVRFDDFIKFPEIYSDKQSSAPKRIHLFTLTNDTRKFKSRKGFIEDLENKMDVILEDMQEAELLY